MVPLHLSSAPVPVGGSQSPHGKQSQGIPCTYRVKVRAPVPLGVVQQLGQSFSSLSAYHLDQSQRSSVDHSQLQRAAAMEWELCKENYQPLRAGRKAATEEGGSVQTARNDAVEAKRRCSPKPLYSESCFSFPAGLNHSPESIARNCIGRQHLNLVRCPKAPP